MTAVPFRGGRFPWSRARGKLLRASLLAAAAVSLAVPGCASRQALRSEGFRAEIVDSREARTLTGDRQYYVTLAYRDSAGASCTTTVQIDQITWMRLRTSYEPCILPYGDHYVVSTCR